MLRVEDKYHLPDAQMRLLESRVACLLPQDAVAHGGYKISSVYFDDLRDSMLNDSLSGNPFREKYRIRIYNDSLETIKLEVKRKWYNRATKLDASITEEEMRRLLRGERIPDGGSLQDARTLFNLAIARRGLRCRVNVTYDRNAYIFEPGNVRITFDRDIRSSGQCERIGCKNLTWLRPDDERRAVIEVKYDQCIPRFLMQVLESGNMLQTANSKYATCRELLQMGGKRDVD